MVLVACVDCDEATESVAQSLLSETKVWLFWDDTLHLQLAYIDQNIKLNKDYAQP